MRLKVQYEMKEENGEPVWNPENFSIWLNGLELDLVNRLTLVIDVTEPPQATITFQPDEIDIDADTLAALTALLNNAEEVAEEE